MFYSAPHSTAISYGKEYEHVAVAAYQEYMIEKGCPIQVEPVGFILSKDRPGFGTSLDSMVIDKSADTHNGGLEVKCPFSKANMDIDEACQDKTFFLKCENGKVSLKRNDNYFYQVQGQMYIAKLEWVDFVVWFGEQKDIFVERIYFDKKRWFDQCLPKLD